MVLPVMKIIFTNCYELDGSQVTSVSAEDVTGGKLCYDLNEGAGKTIFYQTLGTDLHPVFDATHGVVIKDGDKYVNDDLTSINTVDTKLEKGTAVYSLGRTVHRWWSYRIGLERRQDAVDETKHRQSMYLDMGRRTEKARECGRTSQF